MSDLSNIGVSVIVPTWNRAELLEEMLRSVHEDRQRYDGPSEVIVVDSSEGEQREKIERSCRLHDAVYLAGDQSVRRKRNLGCAHARHDLLLFLDSDVTVEPGTIAGHAEKYLEGSHIGAVQGLTEFVGHGGFWWHVAELSGLTESFSNARKYPFQSWSITNNLSVRRDVFERIGRFRDDFPFKLGGDDLEMSYRIAHAGYLIASAPRAVALHAKTTWDNPRALLDRTRRWGTMESRTCSLHPELYRLSVPKNYVLELPLLVAPLLVAATSGETSVALVSAALLVLFVLQRYLRECRAHGGPLNPVHLLLALGVNARYELFRQAGYLSQGHRDGLVHAMLFNCYQARGSIGPDARRIATVLADLVFVLLAYGVIERVL